MLRKILALLAILSSLALADDHHYDSGTGISVWAHSVCPFSNPQETYNYYSLGICVPEAKDLQKKDTGISESIAGYSFTRSLISIRFRANLPSAAECEQKFDADGVSKLEKAIKSQFWYQWWIDDLPVWGLVGEVAENPTTGSLTPYLYTHRELTLAYRDDRIVEVSLNASELRPLQAGSPVTMTYSVHWVESQLAFEHRFERYFDRAFFEHQIHWFSLFNSLMLALFLVGVVVMVLMRTVHRDYAPKKSDEDPEAQASSASSSSADLDIGEESGWKQVAGDVFRAPSSPVMFSAALGTGAQLTTVVTLILVSGALGNQFVERGELIGWFIFLYTLVAAVGGFRSGGFYSGIVKGKAWIRAMAATAFVYPALCLCLWGYFNSVASAYGSIAAAPVSAQIAIVSLWVFGIFPLTFVGTLVGRHWDSAASPSSSSSAPAGKAVNPFPGPIPTRKWYQGRAACALLGGVLPFGTIFIELYFAFAGVWHYKYYYVFGFAFVIFAALVTVTACVSIIAVYYLLNSEDYRWQWTSFLSGASTGLYTFAYCVYFYNYRTQMSGTLQATSFFATSAFVSSVLSLVCGWVAFTAASWFVRRIYATGKTD